MTGRFGETKWSAHLRPDGYLAFRIFRTADVEFTHFSGIPGKTGRGATQLTGPSDFQLPPTRSGRGRGELKWGTYHGRKAATTTPPCS